MFNWFKVISPPSDPCEQGLTHVTPRSIFHVPVATRFSNTVTPSFTGYVTGEMSAVGISMLDKLPFMHDSLLY